MSATGNAELIASAASILMPVKVKVRNRVSVDTDAAVLRKDCDVFTGVAVDTPG